MNVPQEVGKTLFLRGFTRLLLSLNLQLVRLSEATGALGSASNGHVAPRPLRVFGVVAHRASVASANHLLFATDLRASLKFVGARFGRHRLSWSLVSSVDSHQFGEELGSCLLRGFSLLGLLF